MRLRVSLGLWWFVMSIAGGGGCVRRDGADDDDDSTRGGDGDVDGDSDVDGDADADADSDADACGGVTYQGVCDGTVIRWCEDGEVLEGDCRDMFPAPATGSCEHISEAYGYGCAVQPGDNCLYENAAGDSITAFCAGVEPGCVFAAEGGAVCRERVGVCHPADLGACTADGGLILGCEGAGADVDRIEGQPTVVPCGEWGGECTRDACTDLGEGAQCVEGAAVTLTCADVLDCRNNRCSTRRCGDAPNGAGACANGADCGIIDADPNRMLDVTLDCYAAGGDVQACVQTETGLSAGCSECFTHPDPDEFAACAGF